MKYITTTIALLFILAFSHAKAATLPAASYEAEATVNTLTGSAVRAACTFCSGAAKVGFIGNGTANTLSFTQVQASGGSVPVTVWYINGDATARTTVFTVNGSAVTFSMPSTKDWNTLGSVSVNLNLTAGSNTIVAGNPSSYAGDIDRITLPAGTSSSFQFSGVGTGIPGIAWSASAGTISSTGLYVLPTATANTPVTVTAVFTVVGSPIVVPPPVVVPPPPVIVPPTNSVPLSSFGTVGAGGNDTTIVQTAMNSTASKGQTLTVAAGNYNISPVTLPSNLNLSLAAGASFLATSGYGQNDVMLTINGTSNVTITGVIGKSIFAMRKAEYTSGEYRHCLAIYAAVNVTINGIECNSSGGDGMYIANSASNVTVQDSTFDNNRRQGFSLISGNGIFVRRCHFTNTNGTLPMDGIDMEPNLPSDMLVNIHIEDSFETGNTGNGIGIDAHNLSAASKAVDVTILRNTSSGNSLSGYMGTSETPNSHVTGAVNVTSSSSTNDAAYGAVGSFWSADGPALIFTGLTVVNPGASGSNYDGAAVAVKRGGGGVGNLGNVTFTGMTVTGAVHCSSYFTVRDYSNIGVAHIHISNFGTLSGASSSSPLGWLNGAGVSSINIP